MRPGSDRAVRREFRLPFETALVKEGFALNFLRPESRGVRVVRMDRLLTYIAPRAGGVKSRQARAACRPGSGVRKAGPPEEALEFFRPHSDVCLVHEESDLGSVCFRVCANVFAIKVQRLDRGGLKEKHGRAKD